MEDFNQHINAITQLTYTIRKDRRDEWPDSSKSYVKGDSLCNGFFGIVRFADCFDPVFGFDGLEFRRCVIKTIYIQRHLESIFSNNNEAEISRVHFDKDYIKTDLTRFYRKLVMELYVLNRCRHENIIHSHSVFVSDGDLHIVLPRFYVLRHLIEMYRVRKQSDPVPVQIIAKILRQLCIALDYLKRVGIIHRDVQPDNIYMTRQGTVKLGHFGQAVALLGDASNVSNYGCKTPVGKEEYMCFEKIQNVRRECKEWLEYDYSGDVWSLGILVLNMVAYFPEEKCQKLRKDFAVTMYEESMPFIWMTVEMLQLRSRLVKSGGEDLKTFLSDHLLTVRSEKRTTAASLLKTREMQKWCLKTVDEDKAFIRAKFINEVDFANRFKLEDDSPNYECLETKDIPAEFYWGDMWKDLDNSEFIIKFCYIANMYQSDEYCFKFSDAEPLFRILYKEYELGHFDLTDLIGLDYEIKELIYALMKEKDAYEQGKRFCSLKKMVSLPSVLSATKKQVDVEIRYAPKNFHRLLYH